MQNYVVELSSNGSNSYRAKRAADSLDINIDKKLIHRLEISVDLDSPYSVGVIVGASGSGKTTLAKKIFGESVFDIKYDPTVPVIDQFPESMEYDQCAELLNGIGLSSVPCWIKPIAALSNGQQARAIAALAMCQDKEIIVLDEWTSVVDRTVAKAMSFCVQKMARRTGKKIILLSCHYDVLEWLDPDWVIDCNKVEFSNRRLLRREKLSFDVRVCDRSSWKYFSKYHYLSEKIPGGKNFFYGLFCGQDQIGFLVFSNYVPIRKNSIPVFHFNRLVIHPDYCGFGLGVKFLNAACRDFKRRAMCKIMGKFSSIPTLRALQRDRSNWRFVEQKRDIGINSQSPIVTEGGRGVRGMRHTVTAYVFQYIGPF